MSSLTIQANILIGDETTQNILMVSLQLEEAGFKFSSKVTIFEEKDEEGAYQVHLFLEADDSVSTTLLERRISLDNLPLVVGDAINVEIHSNTEKGKKKKGKGLVKEMHSDDDIKPGAVLDTSILEELKN